MLTRESNNEKNHQNMYTEGLKRKSKLTLGFLPLSHFSDSNSLSTFPTSLLLFLFSDLCVMPQRLLVATGGNLCMIEL